MRSINVRYLLTYLTCSKKLTCSQLSPPQGTNRKIKEKTNKKYIEKYAKSSPVRWSWRQSSVKEVLRWEGFVENASFEPGVKEWWIMRVVMMTEMSRQVNEEVSQDITGDADRMNQELIPETTWCISEWAICCTEWCVIQHGNAVCIARMTPSSGDLDINDFYVVTYLSFVSASAFGMSATQHILGVTLDHTLSYREERQMLWWSGYCPALSTQISAGTSASFAGSCRKQ